MSLAPQTHFDGDDDEGSCTQEDILGNQSLLLAPKKTLAPDFYYFHSAVNHPATERTHGSHITTRSAMMQRPLGPDINKQRTGLSARDELDNNDSLAHVSFTDQVLEHEVDQVPVSGSDKQNGTILDDCHRGTTTETEDDGVRYGIVNKVRDGNLLHPQNLRGSNKEAIYGSHDFMCSDDGNMIDNDNNLLQSNDNTLEDSGKRVALKGLKHRKDDQTHFYDTQSGNIAISADLGTMFDDICDNNDLRGVDEYFPDDLTTCVSGGRTTLTHAESNGQAHFRQRVLREMSKLASSLPIPIPLPPDRLTAFIRRYFQATHYIRSQAKRRTVILAAAYILSLLDGDGPTLEQYALVAGQKNERLRAVVEAIGSALSLHFPQTQNLLEVFRYHSRSICRDLALKPPTHDPPPLETKDDVLDDFAELFAVVDGSDEGDAEFDFLITLGGQPKEDMPVEQVDGDWWQSIADEWAKIANQLASLEPDAAVVYDFRIRPQRKGKERERCALVHIAATLLNAAKQHPILEKIIQAQILIDSCQLRKSAEWLAQVARQKVMFFVYEAVRTGLLSDEASSAITASELRYGTGRVRLALCLLLQEKFGAEAMCKIAKSKENSYVH